MLNSCHTQTEQLARHITAGSINFHTAGTGHAANAGTRWRNELAARSTTNFGGNDIQSNGPRFKRLASTDDMPTPLNVNELSTTIDRSDVGLLNSVVGSKRAFRVLTVGDMTWHI